MAFEKLVTYETTGAISRYQVTAFTPEPECTFDDNCADGKECKNDKCECPQIANCKTQNTASCTCITCEDEFEKNDAGECVEAAAKSCDDGEIITAKNGDEFCISNTAMTWENAKIWCTDRAQRLPTIEEMCDGVSYNGAGTECENLKNSASVVRFPWSATVSFLASDTSGMGTAGPGCPVYVNMMSGTMACIGGDNFSPYSFAFCK